MDDVNWDIPRRTRFQEDKYTEVDIKVKRVQIGGPDLSRGKVDKEHSSWGANARLNRKGNEDDDDEGEGESDSSEVDMVETSPAKKAKLGAVTSSTKQVPRKWLASR